MTSACKFGFAALAAAAALMTAHLAATAGELDGVTLRVGTWGGSWRTVQEEIIVPKLKAMGARVEFVTGSPQANLAKLIAARGGEPPIDVIEMIDATLPSTQDFLQPVDLSLIPNTNKIHASRVNEKSIATWITQEGICYNAERFKELGLEPPKTYADLANPKLEGRVMLPDIASGGGLSAVAGMSVAQGGSLKDIRPGLDLVRKMKAVKFWMTGTEALTALKANDIDAAVIHAGWCVRAINAGMPVASAHPVIDSGRVGVAKQGWIGVVKGSPNAKAANIWINEFIGTDFQVPFSKKVGAVSENSEAATMLKDDKTLNKLMILDPAEMEKMLRADFGEANLSHWNDEWNRAISQ